jgi:hypothetical protein
VVSFSSDIVKKHKTAESESEFEERSSEDSDSDWESGKTTKGTQSRNMKSHFFKRRYLVLVIEIILVVRRRGGVT